MSSYDAQQTLRFVNAARAFNDDTPLTELPELRDVIHPGVDCIVRAVGHNAKLSPLNFQWNSPFGGKVETSVPGSVRSFCRNPKA